MVAKLWCWDLMGKDYRAIRNITQLSTIAEPANITKQYAP